MSTQVLRNRLRELRREAGLTIEELSSVSVVGTTVIKAVESGHAPTPIVQAKLARALGARVEDVFHWTEVEAVEAAS